MAGAQARQGRVTLARHLVGWGAAVALTLSWLAAGSGVEARGQGWQAQTLPDRHTLQLPRHEHDFRDELWVDAADGYLDQTSFLRAALVVSGVDSERRASELEQRFSRWVEQQSVAMLGLEDPRERARRLLHGLHRDWLNGQYYAACARVDQTLTAGHFNCVTATMLYHAAALRLGLPDLVISVPGHVFNRLALPEPIDVQTTSATWLDPAAERPPVPTGPERPLTEVQLLGKLFYNRGVAELAQHRYEAAADSFKQALAWDPQDQSASQNLLASLNNGALAAAEHGRFPEALRLLERGLTYDPKFAPLVANYQHIAGQWVTELLESQRIHVAARVVADAARRLPPHDQWLATQRRTLRRWNQRRATHTHVPQDDWWEADAHLTTAAP